MTHYIGRVWSGSHHRVACRLTGRQPQRGWDELWVYPPMEDEIEEARFHDMDTYVSLHQNTATQFISTRTIMDLFLAVERRPMSRVTKWWQYQDGLDVYGMRTVAQEAEQTER